MIKLYSCALIRLQKSHHTQKGLSDIDILKEGVKWHHL